MTVTSAEASKILNKLNDEENALLLNEEMASTFLACTSENPESVRPSYDYIETRDALEPLQHKIRKIKHALNVFNSTTVVPGYGITIDEMLVLLPQLYRKKSKLNEMASRLPKSRAYSRHGRGESSSTIDYLYANYDIDKVKEDYEKVSDELANAQLALDAVNHSVTFELDI